MALGDVEHRTASGDKKPFVAVAHVEVRVEFLEVGRNATDAVGTVDAAEDAVLATQLRQALEGHTHTRLGYDRIVDRDLWVLAFGSDGLDSLFEPRDKVMIRQGIGVVNQVGGCWCCFGDVCDGFATGTIHGREVDNDISGVIDQISKDSVDAGSGVGDEDAAFNGGVEDFCNSFASLVEQFGIVVSDENIWSFLCEVLVVAKDVSYLFGICAECA